MKEAESEGGGLLFNLVVRNEKVERESELIMDEEQQEGGEKKR